MNDSEDNEDDNGEFINTGNDFFDMLINNNRQINRKRRRQSQQRQRERSQSEETETESSSPFSITIRIIIAIIRAFFTICLIFMFIVPYLFPYTNRNRR